MLAPRPRATASMDQPSRRAPRTACAIQAAVACLATAVMAVGCGETRDTVRRPPPSEIAERLQTVRALVREARAEFSSDRQVALRQSARSLDQALRELRRANVAFNTPKTLRLDDSSVIHLLMSYRQPISELQRRLTGLGVQVGVAVQASDVMEANLAGVDFKIEDITPQVQPVGRRGFTEWKWEVEPTEVGRRRLHLTLTALIEVNGEETEYAVRTFERTLTVESVPVAWPEEVTGFIGGNLPWLAPSIFIPGLVALYRRRQKRSDNETDSPAAARNADGNHSVGSTGADTVDQGRGRT